MKSTSDTRFLIRRRTVLAGLAAGFVAVRHWQSGSGDRFEPRLVRVNRIATVNCL